MHQDVSVPKGLTVLNYLNISSTTPGHGVASEHVSI